MKLFGELTKGIFLSRPNRFILKCRINDEIQDVYLPNPGRLWELLFPGHTVVYMERNAGAGRKMEWTAVAVEKDGNIVMLHTHRTNDAVQQLLESGRVPGLEGAAIVKREVKMGRSRIDFLLMKDGRDIYLEVKSCSLFSKHVAMFPDAVTARGKRHLEELAEICDKDTGAAVVFLINSPHVETFSPEYHTDIDFASTLLSVKDKVDIIPLAVRWNSDLVMECPVKRVPVQWDTIEKEAKDSGAYMLLMQLIENEAIEIGRLGKIHFKPGFYVYVGSSRTNLTKRIERHKRIKKKKHWHIDYLREKAKLEAVLPVRTNDDIECTFAASISSISIDYIKDFGSSDCHCPSHLFYFSENPLSNKLFHKHLQYLRMDKPFTKFA